MVKRLLLIACVASFMGGFITGKSAFGANFDDEMIEMML